MSKKAIISSIGEKMKKRWLLVWILTVVSVWAHEPEECPKIDPDFHILLLKYGHTNTAIENLGSDIRGLKLILTESSSLLAEKYSMLDAMLIKLDQVETEYKKVLERIYEYSKEIDE